MPELFGVSWGMYAVLGGLVVILILLIVMSRSQRRKKAGDSPKPVKEPKAKKSAEKKPHGADKRARYADLQQRAAMEEPDSGFAQSPYAAQAPGMAAAAPLAAAGVAAAAPLNAPQAAPQAAAPIGTVPTGTVPQQVVPAAPAPRMESIPMEQFIPGSDPLQTVFLDILSGWGDITQDDTNRLTVFRPERVLALIATAELPKELKSNDQARARLSQLRRWGSGLEQSMKAAQAQAQLAAQQEYAGMAAPPAQAAPPAPQPAAPQPFAPQPAAPQPFAPQPAAAPMQAPAPQAGPPPMATSAAPGVGTGALAGAAVLGGVAAAAAPNEDRSSFYGSPAAGAPGAPLVSPAAQPVEVAPAQPAPVLPEIPQPVAPQPVAPQPAPAWQPAWDANGLNGAAAMAAAPLVPPAPAVPVAQPAPAPGPAMIAGLGAAALAGAPAAQQQAAPEPQPVPAPVETPLPEPQPAPVPQAAPPAPVPEPPVADAPAISAADTRRAEVDDVTRSAEAAIAAAAAAFWAKSDPGLVPQQAAPAAPVADFAQPMAPAADDNFLVDLGGGVSTAAGLLTLPPDEQAITLAFLQPNELEKVINGEGDVELKRAAIDQLRSIGSPAARDIIYRTLDHSDPQVQAKALDAADKLLGADQEGGVELLGPGD